MPVCILRDAVALGRPHRDLLVSPDHALFLDGRLIPARLLVNGMTIVQDDSVRQVEYFHVELARHAILLAEGLTAESYLDTGNRAMFESAGLALTLHPDFSVAARVRTRSEHACAPLTVDPAFVEPLWRRLAVRAEARGFTPPPPLQTSADPDLHLMVEGQTIRPVVAKDGRAVFVLPLGTIMAQLVSRAAAPADVRPWHDDRRRLGVSVAQIVCRRGGEITELPVDHPALSDGWHSVERDGCRKWRWTDGCAALPVTAGAETVELQLGHLAEYPLAEAIPTLHHASGHRSVAAA